MHGEYPLTANVLVKHQYRWRGRDVPFFPEKARQRKGSGRAVQGSRFKVQGSRFKVQGER
jgi:hypothetical protein